MRDIRQKIIDVILLSFTVIGGVFFLNVLEAYLLGYDELPMITSEFLSGKTIPEAYFKRNLAMMAVTVVVYLVSFIYKKNDWSLLRRTIVAFGISLISFFLMLAYLRVLNSQNIFGILISVLIFTGIYMIFWIGYYKRTKDDIAKINQELKKTGN